MPKISYILNTCLGDPVVRQRLSISGVPYEARAAAVEENLKRLSASDWEVVVVGQLPESLRHGDFQYVHHPPVERSRMDALYYRELGARYSTGDVLVFGHDDHVIAKDFCEVFSKWGEPFDILVPERRSLSGAVLNNGKEDGYMGGHVLAMWRAVWAEMPWITVNTEWWDLPMTRIWRERGFEIAWTDKLVVESWEKD